jgi:hypothetical protein
MIARGEIRRATFNPTIVTNAVTGSQDYDGGLVPLAKAGKTGERFPDKAECDYHARDARRVRCQKSSR